MKFKIIGCIVVLIILVVVYVVSQSGSSAEGSEQTIVEVQEQ